MTGVFVGSKTKVGTIRDGLEMGGVGAHFIGASLIMNMNKLRGIGYSERKHCSEGYEMAKARQVVLTPEQERELIWVRDHHQKAYMRIKAAAILKVAAGQAMRQVASHGLLRAVKEECVSDWIDRSESEGSPGLLVRKGRGRKPAFSPCAGATRRGGGDC